MPFPNMIRASFRSSFRYMKYAHRMCCIRLNSELSNIPDLPNSGTGLPPAKRPDLPFVTIYDQYPDALQLYKLDGISLISALQSTKRYMLPTSLIILSFAIFNEAEGTFTEEESVLYAVAISAFVGSYFTASLLINNFVGFLYIDQKTNEIIVSHIDFWGGRVDKKFEPGDLYFKARNNLKDKAYIFLMSRNTKEVFRINFCFASIFSQDLLEENIGLLPDSAF